LSELTLDKLPKEVLAKLDLETVFQASRCVIAAERFQVFQKLDGKKLTAGEVSRRTGIDRNHCEPFLDFLAFLGLLKKRDNRYRNSALANRHFIKARSKVWTRMWSEYCAEDFEALAVMDEVLSTGRSWRKILGKERLTDYERVQKDPQWARDFTYLLYDVNRSTAEILAKNLDLSGYKSLLDVGGGSGVMSFPLVRANSQLRSCILEYKFVCDAANEIIRKERLSRRVKTMVGDMYQGIPRGFDVIMFWNIGFIDTRVMKMAYDSLPEGGMVVRNCSPPSKERTPSPTAFIRQYLSVMPKGQSTSSILSSLKEAGFRSVKYRRISRDFGLITGHKGKVGKGGA